LGFSGRAYTRSLLIDFLRPNILYASTSRIDGCYYMEHLLFKSTDSGATWSDSVSPPSSGCTNFPLLTMDPTDPETLYISGDWEGPYSLLKTTDGGATWSDPLGRGCCIGSAPAIDPTNPATLYGAAPSGLLKSTDGGASWSSTGLSIGVDVLALDPINTSVLYAATAAGLFKSTDSGANWSPINNGLASLIDTRSPVTALVIDPVNSNMLYAATSGYGVFRSIDGGANWTPFNDGLTNFDLRLLALTPGEARTLHAGTGNGIFAIRLDSQAMDLPLVDRR
jgi:hypothetical protein